LFYNPWVGYANINKVGLGVCVSKKYGLAIIDHAMKESIYVEICSHLYKQDGAFGLKKSLPYNFHKYI
jgi:hypothetical protein